MSIKRVETKNFLVFKGDFAMDFCPGVNVLIGSNGTGKTTLLKVLYHACVNSGTLLDYFDSEYKDFYTLYDKEFNASVEDDTIKTSFPPIYVRFECGREFLWGNPYFIDYPGKIMQSVFIPDKDMLSNAKGLPETVRHSDAKFSVTEIDIIEKARVLPKVPEQPLYRKICEIIGGKPTHDGENFYVSRKDINAEIPFSMEASGYRKFALLALLIRNEQIRPGSALFWDEPENSLNPELVPKLVDILLELAHSGVQVFLATHSEMLASYFAVNRSSNDAVTYFSLYKHDNHIKASKSDRFDMLVPNNLSTEPVKLYEKEIEKGLGG